MIDFPTLPSEKINTMSELKLSVGLEFVFDDEDDDCSRTIKKHVTEEIKK